MTSTFDGDVEEALVSEPQAGAASSPRRRVFAVGGLAALGFVLVGGAVLARKGPLSQSRSFLGSRNFTAVDGVEGWTVDPPCDPNIRGYARNFHAMLKRELWPQSDIRDPVGKGANTISFDMDMVARRTRENIVDELMTQVRHVAGKGIRITVNWPVANPLSCEKSGKGFKIPYKCGDNHDNTSYPIRHLLPGGEANDLFVKWMDNVLVFFRKCQNLRVPIIFRPLYENVGTGVQNGAGSEHANPTEYRDAYQYIRRYFNGKGGAHNVLWAYCPNAFLGDEYNNLAYPGDHVVDITSLELYQPKQIDTNYVVRLAKHIEYVTEFARKHHKIPALSETGVSKGLSNSNDPDWWKNQLLGALTKKVRETRPPKNTPQPPAPLPGEEVPGAMVVITVRKDGAGKEIEIDDPNNKSKNNEAKEGQEMAVPVQEVGESVVSAAAAAAAKLALGVGAAAQLCLGVGGVAAQLALGGGVAAVGAFAVGGVAHLTGGHLRVADAAEGCAEDVADWAPGAAEGAGEWATGAAEDACEWATGDAEGLADWAEGSPQHSIDWLEGTAGLRHQPVLGPGDFVARLDLDDAEDFVTSLF